MCGDCWNATMAAPAVAVAARFAWVGHRDRIPFLRRTGADPSLGDRPTDDRPVDHPAASHVVPSPPPSAPGDARADDPELAPVP